MHSSHGGTVHEGRLRVYVITYVAIDELIFLAIHSRDERLLRGYTFPEYAIAASQNDLLLETAQVPIRGLQPTMIDYHAASQTIFWLDRETFRLDENKDTYPLIYRTIIRRMSLNGSTAPDVVVETCVLHFSS